VAELGYAALFIGTLLEGETIVFLAGLAAHHGYLWFPAVVAVSVVGGFFSDKILFHVGRRYGERVYARFPGLAAKAPRVRALLLRWDVLGQAVQYWVARLDLSVVLFLTALALALVAGTVWNIVRSRQQR